MFQIFEVGVVGGKDLQCVSMCVHVFVSVCVFVCVRISVKGWHVVFHQFHTDLQKDFLFTRATQNLHIQYHIVLDVMSHC